MSDCALRCWPAHALPAGPFMALPPFRPAIHGGRPSQPPHFSAAPFTGPFHPGFSLSPEPTYIVLYRSRKTSMASSNLEQRVRSLEQEVADLKRQVAASPSPTDRWWERVSGAFAGDEAF